MKTLWAEAHPDIPIRPVQGALYEQYPVIVYGLEMRKPHQNEPKQRYREQHYTSVAQDNNVIIYAQRFDNVITFSAITQNNPEMCELLIETFEDFMHEYTPVFKELGVSDIFYTRRLPDREVTKKDEDTEERAVAYLVVLEKVRAVEVDKLKEILVRARKSVSSYYEGIEYWVFDGHQYLTSYEHPFQVGDLVQLESSGVNQDLYAMDESVTEPIPNSIPDGLHPNYLYKIKEVADNTITLENLNGSAVSIYSDGMGRLVGVESLDAKGEVRDEFNG